MLCRIAASPSCGRLTYVITELEHSVWDLRAPRSWKTMPWDVSRMRWCRWMAATKIDLYFNYIRVFLRHINPRRIVSARVWVRQYCGTIWLELGRTGSVFGWWRIKYLSFFYYMLIVQFESSYSSFRWPQTLAFSFEGCVVYVRRPSKQFCMRRKMIKKGSHHQTLGPIFNIQHSFNARPSRRCPVPCQSSFSWAPIKHLIRFAY